VTRGITRCRRCGAKNRADWRQCLRCRHALVEASQASAPSGRVRWSWMAAAVVVSGIVAAVAFPGRAPVPVATVDPVTEAPLEPAEARLDAPRPSAPVEAALTPVTREDFARAGESAYAQGQMSVALSAFEGAVAAFPGDADAENNLGQLLSRLGRGAEAVPHLERAAAADPGKWTYRFNLARARGIAGDWEGAVADYRVAATIFPDDHVTLFNLGRALQRAGDHAASVEPLERAVALSPDEPSLLLSLASSYERVSRLPDAAQAYRSFLDRAPRAADAPAIRARIARLEGVGRPEGEVAATLAPQG
jgi:tetratricopeptide (TPR) repeat protein